jgi:thiosulfate sulfurtransferase
MKDYKSISTEKLNNMLNDDKDFILIDLRSDSDKFIPNTDRIWNTSKLASEIKNLDHKEEKIVLYCYAGNTSKAVSQYLIKNGFENIYELNRGIEGWIEDGYNTIRNLN